MKISYGHWVTALTGWGCMAAMASRPVAAATEPPDTPDHSAVPERAASRPNARVDWASYVGSHIVVTKGDGSEVSGVLTSANETQALIVRPDGQLVVVPWSDVIWPREAATSTAADDDPPHVAADPRPGPECATDRDCGSQMRCKTGACVRDDLGALDRQAQMRITAGKWTMVAGGSAFGVGTISFGVGYAGLSECVRISLSSFGSDDSDTECTAEKAALGAGIFLMAVGGVTLIAGGATYGLGRSNKRQARRLREGAGVSLAPVLIAGPRRFAVGLTGRF